MSFMLLLINSFVGGDIHETLSITTTAGDELSKIVTEKMYKISS